MNADERGSETKIDQSGGRKLFAGKQFGEINAGPRGRAVGRREELGIDWKPILWLASLLVR
jgi:hypothetical protein